MKREGATAGQIQCFKQRGAACDPWQGWCNQSKEAVTMATSWGPHCDQSLLSTDPWRLPLKIFTAAFLSKQLGRHLFEILYLTACHIKNKLNELLRDWRGKQCGLLIRAERLGGSLAVKPETGSEAVVA